MEHIVATLNGLFPVGIAGLGCLSEGKLLERFDSTPLQHFNHIIFAVQRTRRSANTIPLLKQLHDAVCPDKTRSACNQH
jgi:hypothetical protein